LTYFCIKLGLKVRKNYTKGGGGQEFAIGKKVYEQKVEEGIRG
jgi:hypothetical protein